MPESFFQLEIWKKGYELTLTIYRLTQTFPTDERFGLTSQLRRSSNSVIANIAESQGRFSYKDRIRVLYVARAEIFETRSHLKVARGLGFLHPQRSEGLDTAYENLLRSINSFIRHLAQKRIN